MQIFVLHETQTYENGLYTKQFCYKGSQCKGYYKGVTHQTILYTLFNKTL